MSSLRKWLKSNGKTQKWAAERLGKSSQAVTHWVSGATIPVDALLKLRELGYDGPAEQDDVAGDVGGMAELKGWMLAHFEQAKEEREALAEILRALAVSIESLKSDPSSRQ